MLNGDMNLLISTTMKNTGIIITSLLGGLIVGSALTMLFTPQSGMETRKQIKDFLTDEIDRMKDKVQKAVSYTHLRAHETG